MAYDEARHPRDTSGKWTRLAGAISKTATELRGSRGRNTEQTARQLDNAAKALQQGKPEAAGFFLQSAHDWLTKGNPGGHPKAADIKSHLGTHASLSQAGYDIREAQQYADYLPPGVSLSEATAAQIRKAIAKGKAAGPARRAERSEGIAVGDTYPISRAFDAAAHPRAPAGSATGGQFAASSGSGAKDTRPAPSNAHPVGEGEKGKRVSDLQSRLNALGFKPPLKVDGIFGPKTLAAVKAFQRSHHLKPDGLVGPKTTAALRAKAPAKHPAKAPAKPPAKPAAKAVAAKEALAKTAAAAPAKATRAEGNAETLHAYWGTGAGAAKIKWGTPGDHERCVKELTDDAKFTPEQAHGYCNLMEKRVTGKYPAQHAAMEKAHRSTPAGGGHDPDGLDASWDDLSGLPDLTGLGVADFEAADPGAGGGMSRAARLGSGARFAALKAKLASKGAHDPGALAAYIGRKRYGKAKFTALAASARKGKGGGMSRTELFRSYPLEDYHVVRTGEGDSSGRVVEAYMTVFGEPAEIYDQQGHYEEDIDRAAFNKRIADVERSRNGFGAVKVFYNHGMTIHGSPSDRYSMPVAVCEGIRVDTRGPVTRSRYLDTPLGNEVLEMWRSGAVTAQSFTGAIIRSSPELRRGQKYMPKDGQLPRVRRLELGLKEYGPTPFPAYQGAELVGVRMSPLGTWTAADDDETAELDELNRQQDIDDEALPPDGEAAAGGPPEVHPSRDHPHRLYAMRTEQMCREAGIAPLKGGFDGNSR